MPKKSAAAPVATISAEVLDKHPLMLTRALSEELAPIVSGEYTIETLRSTFGVEGDEDAVLLELSARGCAFFNQGRTFYAFTPQQGDLNLPIESESLADYEFTTEIIDPDESLDIDGSVYDPDGEGEPDYADLVADDVEELEANPNPTHYPHAHPEPAIEPAAPTAPTAPQSEPAIKDEEPTELEEAMDF